VGRVPGLKRAYLIHGDDHGRVAERRAGLRALAERESGAQGLEILEGDEASAERVVAALSAMTLALGRRFVIVDGVERWKDADAEAVAPFLAGDGDDLTVAFFGRDEGRIKVPPGLIKAVEAAGGDVRVESTVKPWELPKWVAARARELGLELGPGAAKALVGHVGDRQQRLQRELEKLALAVEPGATVDVDDVDELAAPSAERKAWTLADALVARDGAAALRAYLDLRAHGERLTGLLFVMARRLRDAHGVVVRLEAGEAPAQVRRSLRMPPKAAERFLAEAQRSDSSRLREAIAVLADLELETRGGGKGVASEDTAAVEAIARLTASPQ
jgi:DNA polymerase-3 subunit delta